MGSITSRPKIPAAAAVATPQIADVTTATPTSPTVPTSASPEEVAKTRVENILRRSRSMLGNVLTSYRGLLNENSNSPQRKSLLGE